MAFGLNSNPFLLKEGIFEPGSIVTPNLIGTNNTDPDQYFTSQGAIYFRQGSMNLNITREYAEFLAGTPAIIIRKDLIRKQLFLELMLGQHEGETYERFKTLNTQLGYSITTPVSKTVDLMHIGSDEPVLPNLAYRITSARTDGSLFRIYLYNAKDTAEDISIAPSGTEHVDVQVRLEAFPHSSFGTTATDAQKHYGLIVMDD